MQNPACLPNPTSAARFCFESNIHWLVSRVKFTLIVPRFATIHDTKKKKKKSTRALLVRAFTGWFLLLLICTYRGPEEEKALDQLQLWISVSADILSSFQQTLCSALWNPCPKWWPVLCILLSHDFFRNDFLEKFNIEEWSRKKLDSSYFHWTEPAACQRK